MTWNANLARVQPRTARSWSSNQEIIRAFLRDLELNGYAPNTVKRYQGTLRIFARMWGTILLTELTDLDIQQYADVMAQKCRHYRLTDPPACAVRLPLATCPMAQSSDAKCPRYEALDSQALGTYLSAVSSLYKWLLERRYVPQNPAQPVLRRHGRIHKGQAIKRRRTPRKRILCLEDVRLLVTQTPIQAAARYALLAKCFLRPHELMHLRLNPRYANLEEAWFELCPDPAYGEKRMGNNRIIIDAELRSILQRYLKWRETHVARDPDGQPVTDLLFISSDGLPYSPQSWHSGLLNELHRHCVRLDIMTGRETRREDRIGLHAFRAFASTWARDRRATDAELEVLRGDRAPGAIDPYDHYLPRLPGLYREFAPVLSVRHGHAPQP